MPKEEKEKAIKVPVKQRLSFSEPLKYKIESEREINLTKARAFEFLEMKTFLGERPVRESHVQFLYDEWSAGRFLWHNVTMAAARLNGELYRINGQHTAWYRVNIPDKHEPVNAKCTERIYVVDSEEDLRNLYSAFDRGAPRTVGHVAKVMLIGTNAAREIPVSYINKLVAGFRIFFAEDWRTVNANPNDLTGIIQQSYSELFNIVGRFFQLHYEESGKCRRSAVVGAMFSTFERNIKASDEFWSPVWSNVGHTSKNDPRWKLRVFIDGHSHAGIGITGESRIDQESLYRACINTWNRWRRGDEVATVRTTDKRIKAIA